MNDRADRLIKALGDIGEDLIEKAAPAYTSADSASVPVNSGGFVQYGSEVQITKKERIIYWVTHSLGVAAAAILIIGAAVLLIMNWDKIAVKEPDRPGEVTTVTNGTVMPNITEPDTTDRFEQITDTSMPEPYPYNDHEYYKDFYYTWINRFSGVSGNLTDLPDMEKQNDLINYYTLNRVGTPYTLDDNLNLYSWMTKLDLSVDNVCRAIEENNEYYSSQPFGHSEELIFNPYEIDVLKSGDRSRIAEAFATEYSIIIGDKVFNPEWLYYHTIEDYRAVGITPEEVLHKLDMYKGLGLTDEAWAAFSAKLQKYADKADPFGQITDTSMPRPFPEWHDTDNAQFEFQWKTKAVGAAIDCRGRENYDEWNRMCMSIRTPYRLDDNNNVAGVIKQFGITSEEIDEYFEKRNAKWQESLKKAEESGNEGAIMNCHNEIFSEEEINALKSGNDAEIIALFISDYSIWLPGSNYVISPEWLYYHTVGDYAALGIEPQMIAAKIPLYEKTFTGTDNGEDLDEKSWELFKAKLTGYAESAEITDRLAVKTDSMSVPFKPVDSVAPGRMPFFDLWQRKFKAPDGVPMIFFDEQIFPEKNTPEYQARVNSMLDAETPYSLDNSYNDLFSAKALGLTDDELRYAINKRNELYLAEDDYFRRDELLYSDADIEVLFSGDRERIAAYFASDLAIVVGENVFSPQWLYYHTIDDYATAGITPEAVQNILPLYEETFTGEAAAMYANSWDVFKRKLTNYTYRETYSFRLAEITSGFDTELFEKSFYGKWEKDGGSSDDNGILLTYCDDMFTFENWIFPRGIAETDELYILPYINCGVGECYIIKKDAPDVLYKGWWNLASYGGGSDEKDVFIINTASDKYVIANRFENDRELHPGDEIGVWGLYKLMGNSAQSAIFSQFCLETGFAKTGGFDGSGSFTDKDGVVWEIAGTKSLPPTNIYYIGGDGSHDLRLAVRYYEKTEFDSFAERNYTFPEPTEHYFILSFETEISDGGTVCNITRSAYSLPEQDSVEVIVDDGIEEPGPSDEVTIMEDDEF